MNKNKIRQIIIDDSGTHGTDPACSKFCRKWGLNRRTVQNHYLGEKVPSRHAELVYRLIQRVGKLQAALYRARRVVTVKDGYCPCGALCGDDRYCRRCGARLKLVEK